MMADEIDIKVARRLKMARRKSGLTQKQLAVALGIAPQQVQKYESGENRIGVARLWEISEVLGQPIEHFFKGLAQGSPPPPEGEGGDKSAKLQMLINQIEDDDVKDAIITVIESYLAQGE